MSPVRQAARCAMRQWFWGAHPALLCTCFTGTKAQILTPKAAVRQVAHRAMGRWFWGAHPELLFRVMRQQFVELVKRGEYEVYLSTLLALLVQKYRESDRRDGAREARCV